MTESLGFPWEKVPPQFQRAFEERPFDECDLCHRFLLEDGTGYQISKYYAEGELRQELATCMACLSRLRRSYSQQSLRMLAETFPASLFSGRLELAFRQGEDRADLMTRQCLLCQVPKGQADVYFEYAYCDGEDVIYHSHPFMVCGPCALRVYDSLSKETKEAKRRFFERHFGPPPGLFVLDPLEVDLRASGLP